MGDAERFAELRGQTGKRKTAIDLTDDADEDSDHLLQPHESAVHESQKRLRAEEEAPRPPCAREVDGVLPSVQVDAESRRKNAIAHILGRNRAGGEAHAPRAEQHKQLGLRQFFAPVAKAQTQSSESLLTDLEDDDDLQLFDVAGREPSSSSSSPFRPSVPSGAVVRTCQTGCISSDLELALALQMEDDEPESLPAHDVEQPRPAPRRRGNLMQRLASMDRDFTPEDYELLSGLDDAAPGSVAAPGRSGKAARSERKLLLDRFPKIILDKSSAGGDCPICLEKMKPRMEARRLPCLHMFHRRCIDRWLLASDRPRCPVDQGSLDLEI